MDDIVGDPDPEFDAPAAVSGGNDRVISDPAVGAGGHKDTISVDSSISVAEDVGKETAAAGEWTNSGTGVQFVSTTGNDVNNL